MSYKFQAPEICISRYVAQQEISGTHLYHSESFISLNKIIFTIKLGITVVSNSPKRRSSNCMVLSL